VAPSLWYLVENVNGCLHVYSAFLPVENFPSTLSARELPPSAPTQSRGSPLPRLLKLVESFMVDQLKCFTLTRIACIYLY